MFIIVVSGKPKGLCHACYADSTHRLWAGADGHPYGMDLIVILDTVHDFAEAIKHYRAAGYTVHPYHKVVLPAD